jgi:hypothetical protein
MVYLPAILARQSVGSRGECSEIREYATSPGCSVDVMHGRGSLLRHNIRVDIVYCYPCDDFNGVKNFNGVKKFRYVIYHRSWHQANIGTSVPQAGNPAEFYKIHDGSKKKHYLASKEEGGAIYQQKRLKNASGGFFFSCKYLLDSGR